MKHMIEINAVDIPTMYGMNLDEYKEYVADELFFVDHHNVLRSAIAQYPLAVTQEQLRALIAHLQSLESKVG